MNVETDYEKKYKILKRKLKYLIYENEAFTSEIQNLEKNMVVVQRDKNFLLERLLQYEATPCLDDQSTDPEQTESSDGESKTDSARRKKTKINAQQTSTPPHPKKKKVDKNLKPAGTDRTDGPTPTPSARSSREIPFSLSASKHRSPMSNNELENRRLLSFNPALAPPTVPMEMFSTDSSHNDSELGAIEDV